MDNRYEETDNGKRTEIMNMGRAVTHNQTLRYCADNKKNKIGYVLIWTKGHIILMLWKQRINIKSCGNTEVFDFRKDNKNFNINYS